MELIKFWTANGTPRLIEVATHFLDLLETITQPLTATIRLRKFKVFAFPAGWSKKDKIHDNLRQSSPRDQWDWFASFFVKAWGNETFLRWPGWNQQTRVFHVSWLITVPSKIGYSIFIRLASLGYVVKIQYTLKIRLPGCSWWHGLLSQQSTLATFFEAGRHSSKCPEPAKIDPSNIFIPHSLAFHWTS